MIRVCSVLSAALVCGLTTTVVSRAAPINIPETANDSLSLVINNYQWAKEQTLFMCEANAATCDNNTLRFSDVVSFVNNNNKAGVLFISDLENGLLLGTPMTAPNPLFFTEGAGKVFSMAFDAFDNNTNLQKLTVEITSDANPTPQGATSDTINITAVGNAPAPDIAVVPEPASLFLLVSCLFAIAGLTRMRHAAESGVT